MSRQGTQLTPFATQRVVPENPGPEASALDAGSEDSAVEVGPIAYVLCWIGIGLLHAGCVAYCMAAGVLLKYASRSNIGFYLDFYEVTLASKYFPSLAIAYYVVAALHTSVLAFDITQLLTRVSASRRMKTVALERSSSSFVARVPSRIPQTLGQILDQRLKIAVLAAYKHVFTRHGLLGVEFKHFDSVFFVREVVETILQSHQAYQMCRLLTWQRLNRFFVATLIINCWATPLLHHFLTRIPLKRLMSRVCDLILDLFAAVGVPVILVMGYVRTYNSTIDDFPIELWFTGSWIATALNESPLIFFGSWLDAVTRLVFSVSLLSSLDDIKTLIRRSKHAKFKSKSQSSNLRVHTRAYNSRILSFAHWLMFAYGVGVFIVHLHAELRPAAPSSCALSVKPWLISHPACSLVEVNCFRDQILSGDADDFHRIFSPLDADSLTQITLRHCKFVEFGASVQNFRNLIGIKLYNTTLVSWGADAAITDVHHPRMRYLFVVRTMLPNATLPLGLIDHDFPHLLRDVEFVATNLHEFPSDLEARWPPAIALVLEYCGLTEYPPRLASLGLQALSLTGNEIAMLSAKAIETPGCNAMAVRGNPISQLPEDVDISKVTIWLFYLDSSNIAILPPWMTDEAFWKRGGVVTAGGTPLCEAITKANQSERDSQPWMSRVDCTKIEQLGLYPLYADETISEGR